MACTLYGVWFDDVLQNPVPVTVAGSQEDALRQAADKVVYATHVMVQAFHLERGKVEIAVQNASPSDSNVVMSMRCQASFKPTYHVLNEGKPFPRD